MDLLERCWHESPALHPILSCSAADFCLKQSMGSKHSYESQTPQISIISERTVCLNSTFCSLPFETAACGELSYSKVLLWAEAFLQRCSLGITTDSQWELLPRALPILAATSPEDTMLKVVFFGAICEPTGLQDNKARGAALSSKSTVGHTMKMVSQVPQEVILGGTVLLMACKNARCRCGIPAKCYFSS